LLYAKFIAKTLYILYQTGVPCSSFSSTIAHSAESTSYLNIANHDLAVTGIQEVRGVGFKPKTLILISNVAAGAFANIGLVGVNDQALALVSPFYTERWRAVRSDTASGGSGYAWGEVVLVDDGFDINWHHEGGTPTGTVIILYLALSF
jgi:hypothetical protein